jgi:hypothetical protein
MTRIREEALLLLRLLVLLIRGHSDLAGRIDWQPLYLRIRVHVFAMAMGEKFGSRRRQNVGANFVV